MKENSASSIAFFAGPLLAGAVLALVDVVTGGPYALALLIGGSVLVGASLLTKAESGGLDALAGNIGLVWAVLAWTGYWAVWGAMWLAGEGGMP